MNIENLFSETMQYFPEVVSLAVQKKVEVPVTINAETVEVRTSPWEPLQYVCPAKNEAKP